MKLIQSMAALGMLALAVAMPTRGAEQWTEGVNYFLIQDRKSVV